MADNHNGAHPATAREANSPDRLMHGENSASQSPDDIAHWITAYSELLAFKDKLLVDMRHGMESLSKPASNEIQELDVTLILTQRTRYVRRLEFWTKRRAEVGNGKKAPA
jgi:hypothetical protein